MISTGLEPGAEPDRRRVRLNQQFHYQALVFNSLLYRRSGWLAWRYTCDDMDEINKILEAEDGDKYQALLEINIRIAEKLDQSTKDLSTVLTPTEIYILLICQIDIQVCNGGYLQYFYNSATHIEETKKAIQQVGLVDLCKNYSEALDVFPSGVAPEGEAERHAQLDNFTNEQIEKLDQLSDLYYEINDPDALFDYAVKHKNEIRV